MRALSAAELLDVWERGLQLTPVGRVLALLEAACPQYSPAEIAAFPIGRRDALVLDLRDALLGPTFSIVATCPGCGGHLESHFSSAAIRPGTPDDRTALAVAVDGYRVAYRLPTSTDLLALPPGAERGAARRFLLLRCVLEAAREGESASADSLPDHVISAVADGMAKADPQADVELALSCPACAHTWDAAFDVASFFWQELHAWAKIMLRSVHGLARAYGWRESDVLALSPTRRQIYLGLAQ